jgi:predicted nucleic acid-binding protein
VSKIFPSLPLRPSRPLREAFRDFAVALAFQMADLEDAMQAAAALSFGAAFIVTQNIKDYSRSPVKAISPVEFARRNVT